MGESGTGELPRSSGYEIRIKGRLSESFLAAFEDLTVSIKPVETVIRAPVLDQAALYGLLDRIQALGLELTEVRRLPPTPTSDD